MGEEEEPLLEEEEEQKGESTPLLADTYSLEGLDLDR